MKIITLGVTMNKDDSKTWYTGEVIECPICKNKTEPIESKYHFETFVCKPCGRYFARLDCKYCHEKRTFQIYKPTFSFAKGLTIMQCVWCKMVK